MSTMEGVGSQEIQLVLALWARHFRLVGLSFLYCRVRELEYIRGFHVCTMESYKRQQLLKALDVPLPPFDQSSSELLFYIGSD